MSRVQLCRRDVDGSVEDIPEKVDNGREIRSCASGNNTARQRCCRVWIKVQAESRAWASEGLWASTVGREEKVRSTHTSIANTEGQNLRFEQATRVCSEIAKLVDFNTGLESENAFDMGEGECLRLQVPKAEKFVIQSCISCQCRPIEIYDIPIPN